jgi:periplasmic protein CpxP/Spy
MLVKPIIINIMEAKTLKYWKIFAFILIALNIALIVFLLLGPPQGRHPGQKEDGAPGSYLVEKLKFNAQQESAFDKLKKAHHEKIMELKEEGNKLRKSFFDGLTSDSISSSKDSIVNKIAENQKQIELVTYNHFEEVKKLCTPEQKITFNDIIMEVIRRIEKQERNAR